MINYGTAYFFNMLPHEVQMTLNGSGEKYIGRISGSEPFIPSYATAARSFDENYPPGKLGFNNKIIYSLEGEEDQNETHIQLAPGTWHVNRDVQVYLFYNLLLMRYSGIGERISLQVQKIKPDQQTSRTQTAYFFNMTDQDIRLTLNKDTDNVRNISALPAAAPFTPNRVSFKRVNENKPDSAVFGINNQVRYQLADSDADDAGRTLSIQVLLDTWSLKNDIQLYLFYESAIVRMGGTAVYNTPSAVNHPGVIPRAGK